MGLTRASERCRRHCRTSPSNGLGPRHGGSSEWTEASCGAGGNGLVSRGLAVPSRTHRGAYLENSSGRIEELMIVSPLRLLTNKNKLRASRPGDHVHPNFRIFFDEQCARAGTAAGLQIHP